MMRKKKDIRVAIIGTGNIAGLCGMKKSKGPSHARAIAAVKGITVDACVDTNTSKRERFARMWHVPKQYRSVSDLLKDERYDVVAVCTPQRTHYAIIKKLLSSKKTPHVLVVEKPVVCSRLELKELSNLLAKSRHTLMAINHTYRFNSSMTKVRSLVRKNAFGVLKEIHCHYYGGLLNNGTHVADILHMFMSPPIRVISAQKGARGRGRDVCVDAVVSDCLGKVKARLISHDERMYQRFEQELSFTRGRIRIMDFSKSVYFDKVRINKTGEKELICAKQLKECVSDDPMNELYRRIKTVVTTGNKGKLFEVSFKESQKTMNLVFNIRDKVKHGTTRYKRR